MTPRIDVVILSWNDGALLDRAVGSVLRSAGVDVRVIVVDNGSSPPASVAQDPRIRVLRNQVNRGVAPGRNQGVRASDAPLVCVLDSDARLEPACLRALADAVAEASVAVAVPVFIGHTPEQTAGRAPTLGRKLLRLCNLRGDYAAMVRADDRWDVDFGIGACQLFRRAAFEAVGGLDEAYFYGPEDVDFCLRLRHAKWRIVQVAGARCDHPPRRRFRGLMTRRGLAHAAAVCRHLWRHRGAARQLRGAST
jgi:GT2 family glycosyltransferase